jgi:hypothetical protein
VNLFANLLGTLLQAQSLVTATVLAGFLALALRSFVLLFSDSGGGALLLLGRLGGALLFLAGGAVYAVFTSSRPIWGLASALAALGTVALVLSSLAIRIRERRGPAIVLSLVVQLFLLSALLLAATVTLLPTGFLALTEDRPVLLVDVTGETRLEVVRWAAAGQLAREELLNTHRVVFRNPEGALVAEAWIYGDEVAVKGRVLRLTPLLNAAGLPNLFELQFAHNGYRTPERHNDFPHQAVPLPPMGPLAVHPWWRGLQRRLLGHWESRSPADSGWAIRSATTESTYFPLIDAEGKTSRGTYRLVLTPGGLTSS